jgi:diguanylate cyclase
MWDELRRSVKTSVMGQIDSVEQARGFADAALASMARLDVPPTPNNYLIWYSHCSGCYPELSRRLHHLERQGEPFTEARLAELHERFFGTGRQVRLLDETCQRIEATMIHLLEQVGDVSRDAGSYGDKLESFSSKLDRPKPVQELRRLVSEILGETRAMQSRAEQLEAQLAESSEHIDGLRVDLATAQREANTDSLTGIANRKYFDHELRLATEDALANGQSLCLLMADIDHFKEFNDDHGHQVGDQVLRLVAQVLTQSVKGRDLAARYGGEEFAVVLPQTDLEGARKLAEQIRGTVAGNRIRLKSSGQYLGAITLSVGCAQYRPREALSELIQRADDALYRAKRQGRNRVVAAPTPAIGDTPA